MRYSFFLPCLLFSLSSVHCWAAPVDFAQEIRPLFNKQCVSCHGGVKMASDLSFISRSQAIGEAKSGARAIVPGDPGASEIMKRITSTDPDERMPPPDHGSALTTTERETLSRWIKEGAPWKNHWAYEAPTSTPPTSVDQNDWAQNEIDRFVLAAIEKADQKPSPRAEAGELLRRVSLDLTGLPPSPETMEEFTADPSAKSYAGLVDDLLASEHFGERWAAMWMDVARYADSEGMGIDRRRHVWKYRDWLIDAFNADKPFDDFVVEQLAGDLLPRPTTEQLIATTFHRLSQSNNEGGTDDEEFRVLAVIDRVNTTWEALQGVTFGCVQCHSHPYDPFLHQEYYEFMAFFNNTADADLGEEFPLAKVPLEASQNARSAELREKSKAIHQALHEEVEQRKAASKWTPAKIIGVHSSTVTGIEIEEENGFQSTGNLAKGTVFTLDLKAANNLDSLTALRIDLLPRDPEKAKHTPEWGAVLSGISLAFQSPGEKAFTEVKLAEVLADEPEPFYDPNDSLTKGSRGFGPYSKQFRERQGIVLLDKPLSLAAGTVLRVKLRHDIFALGAFPLVTKRGRLWFTDDHSWENFRENVKPKRIQLAKIDEALKAIPATTVPIMMERPPHLARETRVFERGNWLEKGAAVTAGVPRFLPSMAKDKPANRLTLAQWFVSPDNPLTARVFVNRLWQQLFAVGLVETLEDFGSAGAKPSHPELLDYLALRFQNEHQWSVKSILREIVLSATYQQTATASPAHYELDPSNRLLSRGPRQRLTAEMVRDHALAVSGLLSRKQHGPPVHPPIPKGVWKPFDGGDKWKTANPDNDDRYRRALYVYWKRSIPYPMFATFDAPSRELCQQRRLPSNTPLQALTLLNDAVFDESARALAKRMAAYSDELEKQLTHGYQLATSRKPTAEALAELTRLYRRLDTDALSVVASVMLNLDAALSK